MRKIELLAPAKNLATGIEAIRHGADAVYIGGPAFGARAAASNSVEDIATLVRFAHTFGAKVYVTLNTILYEHELAQAEAMIHALYAADVDALIVQDFGLLELNLPPIALHASTQMDTYTPERVKFLSDAGFSQIVLARELTLGQIAACHKAAPETPLEVFVHGAVCVSYSGRCYASQYNFGRSANRGDCAQFCRLAFDLVDADGAIVAEQKHLLSLHDMNRSLSVEEMLLAGVSSFKIEGRLKDVGYVKNITAYYRQRLDEAMSKHSDFCRSSFGRSTYSFTPDPHKSFNRGFSPYFLHGRAQGVEAFDTPKAIGEYVGRVRELHRKSFTVQGEAAFSNGDGLCYKDKQGKLQGFRVNRVEGNELFPAEFPMTLYKGAQLYRNADRAFDKLMAKPTARRVMSIEMDLHDTAKGFALQLTHEDGTTVSVESACAKEEARMPQEENIIRQLSKLGETDFEASAVRIHLTGQPFIPSSYLAALRREAVETLAAERAKTYVREEAKPRKASAHMPMGHLTYMANVSNSKARSFLLTHGAETIDAAMEVQEVKDTPVLMVCKHCLRYSFNVCPTHHSRRPSWKEPLSLRLPDGRLFPIKFDCKKCEMSVYASR